jgi:hypothetical protein
LAANVAPICSASEPKPIAFPPLQIFKDLCAAAGWSLDDVAQLAEQRHFALISSEDVPTPDGNQAHKIMWQAETEAGSTVITGLSEEMTPECRNFTWRLRRNWPPP